MLLGDICTRRCGFCAVPKGKPEPIDGDEPRRVAEAVATLGLKHAVVTSVNRDDDNLGGARVFAETIRQIREVAPGCRVEVLIPDFQGIALGDLLHLRSRIGDRHEVTANFVRSDNLLCAKSVVWPWASTMMRVPSWRSISCSRWLSRPA